MARRRICALLLVAAATAATAGENNFTATSADEGRVKQLATQSYDWLADRAPAAKAFAAQAATQHGPGFVGGALVAVLCMLLGGGKKQTKSGVRRACGELDNSGGSAAAPKTSRERESTLDKDHAGRRARVDRSRSSRRSRACSPGPTPPWWTRSRDAGLFAEFCCCSFDSSPFPPPCLYHNTLPT